MDQSRSGLRALSPTPLRGSDEALAALNAADLRLLISQDIGLKFVMPLALPVVEKEALIEVAHFKGDLLAAILSASEVFYVEHAELRLRVERIVEHIPCELDRLDRIDFDTTSEAIAEALADFRRHDPR